MNKIEHSLILISTVLLCVSTSICAPLFGIGIGIGSFGVRLKTCIIATVIKKEKSINKKTKRTYDKKLSFAKSSES